MSHSYSSFNQTEFVFISYLYFLLIKLRSTPTPEILAVMVNQYWVGGGEKGAIR